MIFEAHSPLGRVVVYTDASREHTEKYHPEMKGLDPVIKQVVENPRMVFRSYKNDDSKDPDQYHVYFELDVHPERPGYWVAVVVENDPPPSGVVTAYATPRITGVQKEGGLIYVRSKL